MPASFGHPWQMQHSSMITDSPCTTAVAPHAAVVAHGVPYNNRRAVGSGLSSYNTSPIIALAIDIDPFVASAHTGT